MPISLRKATEADTGDLRALIDRSARTLGASDYRSEQIEAALRGAFGVDSQLLEDRTYLLAVEDAFIVGCGGWSFRGTLFGGDAGTARDPRRLDPARDAARIRAFFVDPRHARQGVGTLLLAACEADARAHGFAHAELMATLTGAKLYAARGYEVIRPVQHEVGGEMIDFLLMRKALA